MSSSDSRPISAVLVLQNGMVFNGFGFGVDGIRFGECVFTTAQTGYSESLSDPSYAGQILCFANPLIGNIGVGRQWLESEKMYAEGVIVSSLSESSFHASKDQTLEDFLNQNDRSGISEIDTRRLVKVLRDQGNQPCILVVGESRLNMLKAVAFDLSADISTKVFEELSQMVDNYEDIGFVDWAWRVSKDRFDSSKFEITTEVDKKINKTVVVLDCGVKLNILRELASRVKNLIVVPAGTSCGEILKLKPDGVLLSNGPGDPRDYDYAVNTVGALLEENIPMMGICLGHQLLSLALGCKVFKMKFGNRGSNQPVQDLITSKAYLTSQNHGYATDPETIPSNYKVYFQNLNDQSVEGIIHKTKPVFSVQFHPEACGGPQDTDWLFDKFISSL